MTVILTAVIWGALPILIFKKAFPAFHSLLLWVTLGAAVIVCGNLALRPGLFESDSLWTLEMPDRLVVSSLSVLFAGLGVWLTYRAARALSGLRVGPATKLAIFAANIVALNVVCFAFWVLSPQIYYTYYQKIFEDLPTQWVVRLPSDVYEFLQVSYQLSEISIAGFSIGLCFWAFLSLTISTHLLRWKWRG